MARVSLTGPLPEDRGARLAVFAARHVLEKWTETRVDQAVRSIDLVVENWKRDNDVTGLQSALIDAIDVLLVIESDQDTADTLKDLSARERVALVILNEAMNRPHVATKGGAALAAFNTGMLEAALATYTYRDKEFHSMRQRKNQSPERDRKGKADDVVDYVLDKLPGDDRGMTGFREYVIRHTTMNLEYAKIDVNPKYAVELDDEENDSKDKITGYVLDNRSIDEDDPKARVEVPLSTIRSSIHRYPKRLAKRLKNQSAE